MKKVWYRKSEGGWFLSLKEQGRWRQIRLLRAANDKEGRKKAEALAIQLLAARPEASESPSLHSWTTVGHVIDGFLRSNRESHNATTRTWYEFVLRPFRKRYGELRIAQFKRRHVIDCVTAQGYSPGSQNRAIGAIKRAFNWAVQEEHIPASPIAHVPKPRPGVRERILTAEERRLVLTSISDECFRDFVMMLTLTGCRPGEAAMVTAADFDAENGIWLLREHKTARKTGKPRIIYLCPQAIEISRRWASLYPEGPMFRNSRKEPWTRNAIRIRFQRLRAKHPELKGVIAYSYRSSFATDALEAGVPDATVATLLGHTNTATLHRFYARLSHKVEHLRDAAAKATQRIADGVPRDTSS